MDTKKILIQILTKFQDAGVKAATSSLSSLSRFTRAGRGIDAGLSSISNSFGRTIRSLSLFDTIFGRVTTAMLIWSAWRNVVAGFNALADVIVGGNARMQMALNTFTALSKGSRELGQQYIDITRQMALRSGQNVDELLTHARRLPTQVGQNFKAFQELTQAALVLGFIDPVQGVEGAMIALTNAMEGTAGGFRSLIRRFEIGTMEQVKRILEETSTPLEAINQLLAESGISVQEFIDAQKNTLPGAFQGIVNLMREFLRLVGEPTVSAFTEDLIRLRDWLENNMEMVFGLAQAIGSRLLQSMMKFRDFLGDILFGGEDITFDSLFDSITAGIMRAADVITSIVVRVLKIITGIVEVIASLLGGGGPVVEATTRAVGGVTAQVSNAAKNVKDITKKAVEDVAETIQQAVPEAAQAATKSVGEIVSALTSFGNKGKETTKRFVEELTKGLGQLDLEKIVGRVTDHIIDLEAQETAQKESVRRLEDWVDEAEREVKAARLKLKLFDQETADIPERFTRARRRQIEQEILRAEQERDRRKETLDVAKAQLQATKENLQAQREILRLVEAQLKKAEDAGQELFKGFVPADILDPDFDKRIQEFADSFAGRVEPVFQNLEKNFGKITDFIRGLVGADPSGEITEMFLAGERLRTAFTQIAQSFDQILSKAAGFFDGLKPVIDRFWNGLDPNVRSLLLFFLGILTLKKGKALGLALSVGAILNDPSNIMGWLMAAGTLASLVSLPLTIAVGVLVTMIANNQPELWDWITGKRPLQLTLAIVAQIDEALQRILKFIGLDIEVDIATDIAGQVADEIEAIERAAAEHGIGGAIAQGFGAQQRLLVGALASYQADMFGWAAGIKNELVGNSIFPDMVSQIVALFTDMPTQMQNPLINLREMIMEEIMTLRVGWVAEWDQMADATRRVLELRQQAQTRNARASARGSSRQTRQSLRSRVQRERMRLTMDSNETRRFIRDGVFDGFVQIVGS